MRMEPKALEISASKLRTKNGGSAGSAILTGEV